MMIEANRTDYSDFTLDGEQIGDMMWCINLESLIKIKDANIMGGSGGFHGVRIPTLFYQSQI